MTNFSASSDWKFSNHRLPRKYFWLLQENLSVMWPQSDDVRVQTLLKSCTVISCAPINSEKRQLLWMLVPDGLDSAGKICRCKILEGQIKWCHRAPALAPSLTWWKSTGQSALQHVEFATFPSETVSLHRQREHEKSPRLRFMGSNDATERRHLSRLWGALNWPTQTQQAFTPFFSRWIFTILWKVWKNFHNSPSFPMVPVLCSPGRSPGHLRGLKGEPKEPHKYNLQHFLSPYVLLPATPPSWNRLDLSCHSSPVSRSSILGHTAQFWFSHRHWQCRARLCFTLPSRFCFCSFRQPLEIPSHGSGNKPLFLSHCLSKIVT